MKKTALAAVFASIVFINFTASLFAEDKALAAPCEPLRQSCTASSFLRTERRDPTGASLPARAASPSAGNNAGKPLYSPAPSRAADQPH